MDKSKVLKNLLISEIYKNVFYLNFTSYELKYESEILSTNLVSIVEFLGLCYTRYKSLMTNNEIYEFIKGSHYFNIDYFNNKDFILYHNTNPKKTQYDYKLRKKIITDDYEKILEKHLIKKVNDEFYISFVDYKNYNLQSKYPDIQFFEDKRIYIDSLKNFFKKF